MNNNLDCGMTRINNWWSFCCGELLKTKINELLPIAQKYLKDDIQETFLIQNQIDEKWTKLRAIHPTQGPKITEEMIKPVIDTMSNWLGWWLSIETQSRKLQ